MVLIYFVYRCEIENSGQSADLYNVGKVGSWFNSGSGGFKIVLLTMDK